MLLCCDNSDTLTQCAYTGLARGTSTAIYFLPFLFFLDLGGNWVFRDFNCKTWFALMQSKPGRVSCDSFPSLLSACLASLSLVSWALKWRQCIQGKDITSKLLSINRPGCRPEVARSAVRIWLNGHLRIPTCAWCGDYSCYPKQRSFFFSQHIARFTRHFGKLPSLEGG